MADTEKELRITRASFDLERRVEEEYQFSMQARARSDIDYIAMMADIDIIPEEAETESATEVNNNKEAEING